MTDQQSALQDDAVQIQGGKATTTSLIIAEVFGKRHDDVLKRIRSLDCSPEFTLRNFAECSRKGSNNKPEPFYRLTRDGFVFLCMGFTGAKAARWKEAYIEAFNRMEAELQERRAEQYQPAIGPEGTGRTLEIRLHQITEHAEWDTAGNLWLGDLDLDRLLEYKAKNVTLALWQRHELQFPEGSVYCYREESGQLRAIFTPMAWSVIARLSASRRAPALALAAVQYYVPPQMLEVDRDKYQRLTNHARQNRDHFQRIAAASGELSNAVMAAYESAHCAVMSIEEPGKPMPRINTIN